MLTYRNADIQDLLTYFEWVNDDEVRKQSFNSEPVKSETHKTWFLQKLNDDDFMMLVFENDGKAVGQVRFQKEKKNHKAIIGITVDKQYRGKGLATTMLQMACESFLSEYKNYIVQAFIKKDNMGSIRTFEKAGFLFLKELVYQNVASMLYIKENIKQ